ncbi:hypothetical protein C7N83_09780 [Neisseria iguanae]|uniref:Uncharacterized protein n=1 Tax=Neisseria iguanae TaxID=90242 RepID=A0A2P7TYS7_9NEIS|nr:hypothetical protein C7N83_09780 [Neisseria iguanae]
MMSNRQSQLYQKYKQPNLIAKDAGHGLCIDKAYDSPQVREFVLSPRIRRISVVAVKKRKN